MPLRLPSVCLSALIVAAFTAPVAAQLAAHTLDSGWQMQDVARVTQSGAEISRVGGSTKGWYKATVPGTVLTTLVDNKVYPEPTYGENNRPEIIPDSLVHTSYWYRTELPLPVGYAGKHVWLNFEGINYAAEVWVNGTQVGRMQGAFARGTFDITKELKPAMHTLVIAVLISPEPHPGHEHEHTWLSGVGQNGGIPGLDGPTFVSVIGWDWLAPVRDRDTGIWQKVYLSTTGPVRVEDPAVTSELAPKLDSSDVTVKATVENVTDEPQKGVLKGAIGSVVFEKAVELAPHSTQVVSFDVASTPALHMEKPRLWWPNGYGPQNLYKLHLSFVAGARTSDTQDVTFGVRKVEFSVPDSDNLTISVNGVRVFIRGGDWGLDEAMKRIPRARLEAQIRMHRDANLNMIRNWVGQSTSEDFYELCDKYGIMVWDEFFQANKNDGPNPDDVALYIANVKEKVLRFRNHPSIALWCGRNESYPPADINEALEKLMAVLDPQRLYHPNSAEGKGVKSSGPYYWRLPRDFYKVDTAFKTEIGSMSVPTLESIHGMMPQKDWEVIGDDWAQHDFAMGAQRGNLYPAAMAARFGAALNLADFVRKAQLMNYEAFRSMYEGRNAVMFHPTTGVITWMSHPAQPSFVWQLYHYDLEPNAALFAVMHAAEKVHVQLNEVTNELQVVNNDPDAVQAVAHVKVYNMDGTLAYEHSTPAVAAGSSVTGFGVVAFPETLSPVHFVSLQLESAKGEVLSRNFYWHSQKDDLSAMNSMPVVKVDAKATTKTVEGKRIVTVVLRNSSTNVALMAHLQLRRKNGERILPAFYSDNYVSLAPGESRTITVEADALQFHGSEAIIAVDGWNIAVAKTIAPGVTVELNEDAQVDHWPVTHLPFQTVGLRHQATDKQP